MTEQTHISLRMTPQRRANLNALAEIAHTDGDTATLDFALSFTLARLSRKESTMNENGMNRQVWVCSECGRTVQDDPNWTRGWLIGTHRDLEKAFNGEMVIRCPDHITDYAIRNVEGGRRAIRAANAPTVEERARNRVSHNPELRQYEDVIFYDWPEGGEHLEWVATAPAEEIVMWAQSVGDPEDDAAQDEWRKENGLYPYDRD